MTIKAYPIIYSRTKYVDYVPDFLVRPEDFDTEQASIFVSKAMEDIAYSNGIRHTVFSIGDYYVYGGVACATNNIISQILAERKMNNLNIGQEKYLKDEKGRALVFFIGFAIKKRDLVDGFIPDIDLYDTYNIFLQHLKTQWEAKITNSEPASAIELDAVQYSTSFIPNEIEAFGRKYINGYSEQDYKSYIQYYFTEMIMCPNRNISFLSQVLSDNLTKDYPFTIISVYDCSSEEAIQKHRKKIENPFESSGRPLQKQKPIEAERSTPFQSSTSEPFVESKKKTKLSGLVAIAIAIILLIVIMMLVSTLTSKAKAHYSPERPANHVEKVQEVFDTIQAENRTIQENFEPIQVENTIIMN